MLVSLFMDVEDPINPLSDPAALDIATLFTDAGVRGSFCLTGDKCRSLLQRKRQDIIEAFKPHCLGLHTNGHSRHPTTMELLEKANFEDGTQLAIQEETKGFDAFVEAFGRKPTFWGGAGNTWSPEITEALKHLGIPAYAYALTQTAGAVHAFNGVFGLPQAFGAREDHWVSGSDSAKMLELVADCKQPWIGLFLGHPTRLRHVEYWDRQYFDGRTPPSPEFTEAKSVEDYEASKTHIREFLLTLKTKATIVGVDDLLAMDWQWRAPDAEEKTWFRTYTPEAIRGAAKWGVNREIDPELIVAKTMDLEQTLEIAELAG